MPLHDKCLLSITYAMRHSVDDAFIHRRAYNMPWLEPQPPEKQPAMIVLLDHLTPQHTRAIEHLEAILAAAQRFAAEGRRQAAAAAAAAVAAALQHTSSSQHSALNKTAHSSEITTRRFCCCQSDTSKLMQKACRSPGKQQLCTAHSA